MMSIAPVIGKIGVGFGAGAKMVLAALFLTVCATIAGATVAGAAERLTIPEVKQVLAQAIAEATARGRPASIAVVDRVGNVLALYDMTNTNGNVNMVITSNTRFRQGDPSKPQFSALQGLDGVAVPPRVGALAKAITGAYLSSGGNAFTTRTANQIIQEHFNPLERFAPSGPLFGVQFSQTPCSDLVSRTNTETVGPKRSPLGLAADPGGLPLYKNGEPVGAIGVIADGLYSIDIVVSDFDSDLDELIAVAGQVGFEPPVNIRGNRITVEGKTFRYTDRDSRSLVSNPASATPFDQLPAGTGTLVSLASYFDASGGIRQGTIFGQAESGYRRDVSGAFAPFDAFILVDAADAPRFPPSAGSEGTVNSLTAEEVRIILRNALQVAFRGRAQIRRPLNSFIQVTVSVVDTNGKILGVARTPDGPVFGTDVSLQKARTAAFFSNTGAADDLLNSGNATVASYVARVRAFVNDPTALANGIAFADRSGGNLSRPLYPDGIDGSPNGPLSRDIASFTPFHTGLQTDLLLGNLVAHVGFLLSGGLDPDTAANCTPLPVRPETAKSRLANGMQIFPGSVPIFRGSVLVGGIGVSGDGVDQDDMISFLGLHNAGLELANGIGNAPPAIRADNLVPQGTRLRYISCPFAPFLDSNEQNPCNNK
jgi:uncharacterized protein GlcG (DUF336 family)